jgi:hypothetical protein
MATQITASAEQKEPVALFPFNLSQESSSYY